MLCWRSFRAGYEAKQDHGRDTRRRQRQRAHVSLVARGAVRHQTSATSNTPRRSSRYMCLSLVPRSRTFASREPDKTADA